jgi:tripartite-type tricarboxylate transporter receptor subunit TctC
MPLPIARRRFLTTLALAVPAVLPHASAFAQSYAPARPVRFLVPFPPGGAIDTLARLSAQHLSGIWGQPVTVENRPGAGGLIGTEALAKAAPDGLTFGWGAVSTHGINAALYRRMPYDPLRDFAPVAPVALVPNLLVVNAAVPAQTVGELVALARQQPGKLSYASAGSGTTLHISCELFKRIAGVDLLHVPYKGSGPALTDVLAGQVPVMCDSVTSALPHLRSGKLRALGITSTRRSSLLPAVPTLAEAGLKDYEMNPWFGLFAPAGTPSATVAQVNHDIQQMLMQASIKARLADIGAEPMAATPEQFAALVRADLEKWGRLVRDMGITAD